MLTLNDLSKTLVELTGCQPTEADDFLRELFALAAEILEAEGSVEVPHLGRFVIMDGTIHFRPDADLATEVNTPFADFQPMEVPDTFSLQTPSEPEPAEAPEPEPEPEPAPEPEPEPEAAPEPAPEPEPEPSDNSEPSEPSDTPAEANEEVKTRKALTCCRTLMVGLVCAIAGFVGGWFAARYYSQQPFIQAQPAENSLPAVIAEPEDSVEDTLIPEISEPSDSAVTAEEPEIIQPRKIVTDTVKVGRYLTTMARSHYGQKEYWVYIYEANPQFGNPNTLPAGTVVIIPPADSLGLTPGNEEKLAEAHRKLNEILSRFN